MMGRNNAKKLARYHKFTKVELYQMLVEALDTHNDAYWKKPNPVNPIFDNGYYFNFCKKILDYKEGENEDVNPSEIIVVRVLQGFGEFSKVQLPKKPKRKKIDIKVSEKPVL